MVKIFVEAVYYFPLKMDGRLCYNKHEKIGRVAKITCFLVYKPVGRIR